MKFRLLRALLVGVTAVVIAGCGGSEGASQSGNAGKSTALRADEVASVSAVDQAVSQGSSAKLLGSNVKGYVVEGSIWPTRKIPVCFAVTDETFQATEWQRQIIRSAVENSWEANSEVKFTGWDICPISVDQWVQSVRVKFEDDRPRSGVGTGVYPLGMYLNPVYNFYYNKDCGGDIKKCLEFDAIHEFGHALGFSHEQNRPIRRKVAPQKRIRTARATRPLAGGTCIPS